MSEFTNPYFYSLTFILTSEFFLFSIFIARKRKWEAQLVKMHEMSMADQMKILWHARVLLTINGAQVMAP